MGSSNLANGSSKTACLAANALIDSKLGAECFIFALNRFNASFGLFDAKLVSRSGRLAHLRGVNTLQTFEFCTRRGELLITQPRKAARQNAAREARRNSFTRSEKLCAARAFLLCLDLLPRRWLEAWVKQPFGLLCS